MGKLSPINKDDLKVGDVIGVAREIRCGWGASFRHFINKSFRLSWAETHCL